MRIRNSCSTVTTQFITPRLPSWKELSSRKNEPTAVDAKVSWSYRVCGNGTTTGVMVTNSTEFAWTIRLSWIWYSNKGQMRRKWRAGTVDENVGQREKIRDTNDNRNVGREEIVPPETARCRLITVLNITVEQYTFLTPCSDVKR